MFKKKLVIKTKTAFTLIELLIVVLIIGILAAIALPQYQKAVERSKTTKLKVLVRNIATAEESYLQTNGRTTTDFNDLDLTLSGTIKTGRGSCGLGSVNYMEFDDFDIVLGTGVGTVTVEVTGTITNGKYKCGGFSISLDRNNSRYGRLLCMEPAQAKDTAKGKYCAMAGYPNLIYTSSWDDRFYSD